MQNNLRTVLQKPNQEIYIPQSSRDCPWRERWVGRSDLNECSPLAMDRNTNPSKEKLFT